VSDGAFGLATNPSGVGAISFSKIEDWKLLGIKDGIIGADGSGRSGKVPIRIGYFLEKFKWLWRRKLILEDFLYRDYLDRI